MDIGEPLMLNFNGEKCLVLEDDFDEEADDPSAEETEFPGKTTFLGSPSTSPVIASESNSMCHSPLRSAANHDGVQDHFIQTLPTGIEPSSDVQDPALIQDISIRQYAASNLSTNQDHSAELCLEKSPPIPTIGNVLRILGDRHGRAAYEYFMSIYAPLVSLDYVKFVARWDFVGKHMKILNEGGQDALKAKLFFHFDHLTEEGKKWLDLRFHRWENPNEESMSVTKRADANMEYQLLRQNYFVWRITNY